MDGDGYLWLTIGETPVKIGLVKGTPGAKGETGEQGPAGKDGTNGTDGNDGADGVGIRIGKHASHIIAACHQHESASVAVKQVIEWRTVFHVALHQSDAMRGVSLSQRSGCSISCVVKILCYLGGLVGVNVIG
jgi:hypothetical protein